MNRIMNKVVSGRWILTVIIGFVFGYCAIQGVVEPKDVVVITLLVIKEYFGKEREIKNENTVTPSVKP